MVLKKIRGLFSQWRESGKVEAETIDTLVNEEAVRASIAREAERVGELKRFMYRDQLPSVSLSERALLLDYAYDELAPYLNSENRAYLRMQVATIISDMFGYEAIAVDLITREARATDAFPRSTMRNIDTIVHSLSNDDRLIASTEWFFAEQYGRLGHRYLGHTTETERILKALKNA